MRGPVRSTVEGLTIGVAAASAMAAVALVGTQLAFAGTGVGTGIRARAGAAAVAMSVGAPLDLTMSGTAVPGRDRLPGGERSTVPGGLPGGERAPLPGRDRAPLPGGLPVTVSATVDARPLGVTVTGIAVLVLLFRWRRRYAAPTALPLAAGAFVGFVAGVGVCAFYGRAGPVVIETVTLVFRTGPGSAVLGAVVLASLTLGACLLPPLWRRPVAAVATVIGGLAALATVAGTVIGATIGGLGWPEASRAGPAGGMRMAGGAVLAGANALGSLPWGLGVPWSLDLDGPLAGPLRDRIADLPDGGGRLTSLGVAAVCVLLLRMLTTRRGWPTASAGRKAQRRGRGLSGAARLGAALAGGFAAVTVATAASVTATATVFVIELRAAEMSLRGNVFVALVIGGVIGALVGLARPRVRSHGVPSRRR